jgi:hypothetical protein
MEEGVMRLHIHTAVPVAVALIGMVLGLSVQASAGEADPASAIRGSLGVSLDDLSLSNGTGATVFLLNAGFVLLFAAVCIAVRRADSRKRRQAPLRGRSNFVR